MLMVSKTIRLPADLYEALCKEADERGITLHDMIMFILWKSLKDIARL